MRNKMFCLRYDTLMQIVIGESLTLRGNTYAFKERGELGGYEGDVCYITLMSGYEDIGNIGSSRTRITS